jgi:hypothetical protein
MGYYVTAVATVPFVNVPSASFRPEAIGTCSAPTAGGIAMTDHTPGVFLLGVGAQKAGTSWLHQQLHQRSDADFGFLKEYHIHDALTIPKLERFRHLNVQLTKPRSWLQPRSWRRQRFFSDPRRYYNYFAWLLRRPRRPNRTVCLTGDITPSYAVLSADTFRGIHNQFQQRGIPVRPVFLLRDPIERIISSQRMKLRKQGRRDAATEVASLRKRVHKGQGLRSNYNQTLEALDQAFGLEHCFIGLFETLFQQDSYTALCDYLEITYQQPDWQQKVNASATANLIPDDLLAELGQQQAADFKLVCRALPQMDFAKLWPTTSRWCS